MTYKEMLFDGKVLDPNVCLDSLYRFCKSVDTLHYYSISEVYNELYRSGFLIDYANVMDFIFLLNVGYFKISCTDFDLDCEVDPNGRKE